MKNRLFYLTLISVLILFFTGCTSVVNSNNITPGIIHAKNNFKYDVQIFVDGGFEKSPLGSVGVPNKVLLEAVQNVIKNSSLFQNVSNENTDYKLNLFILKSWVPLAGYTMKGNIEIVWILQDKFNNVVWKKSFLTEATAGVSDASSGQTRTVVVLERATKENIKQGLESISNLEL